MSTITEFLTARLDEREQAYQVPDFVELDSSRGPGWGNRGACTICGAYQFDGTEPVTEEAYVEHLEDAHQLTWALADIAAKRSIVALHSHPSAACYWSHDSMEMHEPGEDCDTLRLLAQPFAEHADFDRGWRA